MKVLGVLIGCFALIAVILWFLFKMNEWTESSIETKSNIGCWVLSLVFIVFSLVAIFSSIKSCSHDAANKSPRYDYYDDRTPR